MGGFGFIDQITAYQKGESLEALFTLKGQEEFLQDHFEGFPVMPGVLMIEAMRQAASHLLALSSNLQEPAYRLVRAENVRFGQFVKPGSLLRITAQLAAEQSSIGTKVDGRIELVSCQGIGAGTRAISAKLTLVPVFAEDQQKTRMRQNIRLLLECIRQERQDLS
ncbi:MAG: 3-hydroxyacyl-ACP dehydratase FabZ family protein [Candidatus Omnitrophota bacterium]